MRDREFRIRLSHARFGMVVLNHAIGLSLILTTCGLAIVSIGLSIQTLGGPGQELLRVLQSGATWLALLNSVVIAMLGLCIAWVTAAVVRRSPLVAVPAFIVFLSFDPISRSIALRDLFMSDFWGVSNLQAFLSPAVSAGMQYCLVPLLAGLGRPTPPTWTHGLTTSVRWLFVELPPTIRAIPAPSALVFLLILFDVGVVQAASGNRLLLWAPLLLERTVQSNSLSAGATMLVIGLATTVLCYLVLTLLGATALKIVRRITPRLWPERRSLNWTRHVATAVVAAFAMVPLVLLTKRAALVGLEVASVERALGIAFRTSLSGWFVAVVAVVATMWVVLGSLHSEPVLRRVQRASVVPALAPEHAFVLVGVMLVGTGVLSPGLLAVVLMQLSFAVPVAVFVGVSVLRTRSHRGALPFSRAFSANYGAVSSWAAYVFRREICLVLAICVWLVADDYLVAHYMNAPSTPLLTPNVFQSTRRDISSQDLTLIFVGAAFRLLVVIAPMMVLYHRLATVSSLSLKEGES